MMNLRQAFNREFRRQMGSRGMAERYAKKGDQGSFGWAKKDDQKQFRWITLNGGSGPDGHGGTPVLIDAKGTIQGGPKDLEGKSLGDLGGKKADEPKAKPKAKPKAEGAKAPTPKPKTSDSRADLEKQREEAVDRAMNGKTFEERSKARRDIVAIDEKINAAGSPESAGETAPEPPAKPKAPTLPPEDAPKEVAKSTTLFEDAVDSGATPREAAEKARAAADADYAYARESAIPNAGEDLKGSARHRLNEWRGLAAAEANGTAEGLVTRDQLLANEPHNLMATADENPMGSLAMYLALKKFPPKPRYRDKRASDEVKAKNRKQYVEAYQKLKGVAENIAKREMDPIEALSQFRESVRTHIQHLREGDRYNSTANALVDLANATVRTRFPNTRHVMHALGQFATKHRQDFPEFNEEAKQSARERAKQIMEGKSLSKVFGEQSKTGGGRTTFNPADRYVAHAERKGGRDISTETATPVKATEHLVNSLGIRGVQWGNSVSDDERHHHAKMAAGAFADLVDITGIDPRDVSLEGTLGLAIGARGKGSALAHYESGNKVINLTRKKGVGSLAHEWGHAFDHAIAGGNLVSDMSGRQTADMMSERLSDTRMIKEGGQWKSVNVGNDPMWRAMHEVRQKMNESGFSRRLGTAINNHVKKGTISKSKREYWRSHEERFARCFERYVQHKLESGGRSNTYLSGVSKTNDPDDLWPHDSEIAAMAPAFDALFAAYNSSKGRTSAKKYSRKELVGIFTERFEAEFSRQTRYARGSGERWITLNAGSGDDGSGGTPVRIDGGGKITAGPSGLEGKSLGKLDKGKKPAANPKQQKSPKQSKVTIRKAAAKLEERGYKLVKPLEYDHKAKEANYLVRQPDGSERKMTAGDIKGVIAKRSGVKSSLTVRKPTQPEGVKESLTTEAAPEMSARESGYQAGLAARNVIENARKEAGAKLKAIPGVGSGDMGLTPDSVKNTPEYREAFNALKEAQANERNFNAKFTKKFQKELKRDRARARGVKQSLTPEPESEGPDVGELAREAIERGENVRGLFKRRGISLHKDRDLTLAVGDEISRLQQQRYSRLTSRINAEFVRRYEKPPVGRWVTLNGDGEGSGSKVFIKDGEITKGPKSLTGKPINSVDKGKSGTSKDKRKNSTPPRPDWMKKQPSPDLPTDDDGNFTLRRDKATPDFTPPKSKARDLFEGEAPLSPTDGPDKLPGASKPLTPLQRRADGQVVGATQVHYSDLKVDPKRFQYKFEGIGDDGVTDELKGVRKFNPMLGGQLLAWFDPEDGQSYVVNGHHRHELARRSGEHEGWDGNMPVYFVEAKTAKTARALGALANIAEGRGTAVDAAKFLRDTGVDAQQLYEDHGISLKGAVARDSQTLTKLAEPLFQKLAEGMMTTGRALAISSELSDHGKQAELMGQIEKAEAKRNKDLPDAAVREMAKMMGLATTKSQQGGLFDDFAERSSFVERAELMAALRRTLSSDRNTFRQASSTRRQSALESTGTNTLDVEGNRQRAQAADVALFDFDARANAKGDEIATAISEAAEELADAPRKRKSIEKRLTERVRGFLGEADAGGTGRSGKVAEGYARSGRNRQPARYARQRERMIRQVARRLKL